MIFDQIGELADPFVVSGSQIDHFDMGYCLNGGMFFPLYDGVLLIRRALYPSPSRWGIVGWKGDNSSEITHGDGVTQSPNQAYQFSACRVLRNGYTSELCEPQRLDFDGAGALIAPGLPNWPTHVTARPLSAGRVAVNWEYCRYGEGGPPADFRVFVGDTAETIDWNTPLTDAVTGLTYVPFTISKAKFSFTSPTFSHGTIHYFGVRSRNATPLSELNEHAISNPVTSQGLAPQPIVLKRASARRL